MTYSRLDPALTALGLVWIHRQTGMTPPWGPDAALKTPFMRGKNATPFTASAPLCPGTVAAVSTPRRHALPDGGLYEGSLRTVTTRLSGP